MKHIKVCISCFADEKECRCEEEQVLKDFCDDCNCFMEDCECPENDLRMCKKNKDAEGQLIF